MTVSTHLICCIFVKVRICAQAQSERRFLGELQSDVKEVQPFISDQSPDAKAMGKKWGVNECLDVYVNVKAGLNIILPNRRV